METLLKWIIITFLVSFPFFMIMRFSIQQYDITKPRSKIVFVLLYISLVTGLAIIIKNGRMFFPIIAIGFIFLFLILSYLFVPKGTFSKIFKTKPSRLLYKDVTFWLVVTVLFLMIMFRLTWSKIYIHSLIIFTLVVAILLINNYIQFKRQSKDNDDIDE
ncbi:MAG: hypothetical protein CVV03_03990 [Firmicutes bacterium HGW-Firmicutes-8]|nr:MAG: hypothetical protein CVV03_03990 [Firmicutes bacterium HGW-Firmicutes-8]